MWRRLLIASALCYLATISACPHLKSSARQSIILLFDTAAAAAAAAAVVVVVVVAGVIVIVIVCIAGVLGRILNIPIDGDDRRSGRFSEAWQIAADPPEAYQKSGKNF